MVVPGRTLLSGTVEIDECFIGGYEAMRPGRGAEKKALVIVAIELKSGHKLGRARMGIIESASSENLLNYIKANIEPGSHIVTDGWSGYSPVKSNGYSHEVQKLRKGREELTHVHLLISLLKRWILGTHQGAVSHVQLEYYLEEFVFRFNRRKSKNRNLLFLRLLQSAVQTTPTLRTQISKHSHEYIGKRKNNYEDSGI
jgi:transposase-like protein